MRTRRLIKIPLGGYILCALLVLNFYQFNENQKLTEERSEKQEKNEKKILFYTAVRDFGLPRARHYKMFRRQFRNLYETKANSSNFYSEIFLDNSGYSSTFMNYEDEFPDTLYTSNIPESFAIDVMKNANKNSLFVFMSNHQFDITEPLIEKLKELKLENDEIACLNRKNEAMLPESLNNTIISQCHWDIFAINAKTAEKIRDALIVQKEVKRKQEPERTIYEYTQKLLKADYQGLMVQNKTGRSNGSAYWTSHLNSFTTLLSCSISTKFNYTDHSYLWEDFTTYPNDSALKAPFDYDLDAQINELPPQYQLNDPQDLIRYLRRPRTACSKGTVVSFIKCARGDFFEREWIRDYYQKMAKKGNFDYNIFFLLGTGETLKDEIDMEATKYDDLVIGDFVDTYENLPLKTFLGFQFFAGFCYGNKKIINFHDSDAFVLLPDIVKDYKTNTEMNNREKKPWEPDPFLSDESIYCIKGQKINIRFKDGEAFPGNMVATYTSKWYNWIADWPPQYSIPEYCNGNCNSMGPEAAMKIWKEAQRTNRYTMRIEDKFYLGILRVKAGIPNENIVAVTNMLKFDPSMLNLNGLHRCMHVSEAEMYENPDANLLELKKMNKTSLMNMLTDWYINGDWTQTRKGFLYGGKDHLLARQ